MCVCLVEKIPNDLLSNLGIAVDEKILIAIPQQSIELKRAGS